MGFIKCIFYFGNNIISTLDEFEINNLLSLYPNPVSSLLYLNPQNGIEIYSLKLFNSLGQSLHIRPSDDFKTIDMGNVPKGFYILSIETSKGILVRKVQKE